MKKKLMKRKKSFRKLENEIKKKKKKRQTKTKTIIKEIRQIKKSKKIK